MLHVCAGMNLLRISLGLVVILTPLICNSMMADVDAPAMLVYRWSCGDMFGSLVVREEVSCPE
jgi:hypothetical protein